MRYDRHPDFSTIRAPISYNVVSRSQQNDVDFFCDSLISYARRSTYNHRLLLPKPVEVLHPPLTTV